MTDDIACVVDGRLPRASAASARFSPGSGVLHSARARRLVTSSGTAPDRTT